MVLVLLIIWLPKTFSFLCGMKNSLCILCVYAINMAGHKTGESNKCKLKIGKKKKKNTLSEGLLLELGRML